MSNSRRSQMAEAIFNALSGNENHAKSAGIDPAGCDWKVDENVITVLKEIGIDASHHQSKHLTGSMLEESDLIITFRCAERIPTAYKSKVENWELGIKREVGQKQPERSLDELRKMRDMIYERIGQLIEKLERGQL